MTERRRAIIAFCLFLLPWFAGFLLFQVGPMVASAVLVFTEYNILKPPVFIGMENLRQMFSGDELFWLSLRVTASYTVVVVPLSIVVGYSLALLLNQKVIGLSFWRTAYYMPSIVPAVATAFLWGWMFNRDFGPLNGFLAAVGLPGVNWLGSEQWVLPAFFIMTAWGAGGGLIIYLAALQQVPTTLYEAATIDGANAWQRFRHVTLPMTSFVIFFSFITGVIGSFQVFTGGYVMTDGGPNNASLFYVLYLYRQGWRYLHMGYASALAWFLFLVILVLTYFVLRSSRYWVYYAGEEGGG
jgi:multiple sugar transport system permease protein